MACWVPFKDISLYLYFTYSYSVAEILLIILHVRISLAVICFDYVARSDVRSDCRLVGVKYAVYYVRAFRLHS